MLLFAQGKLQVHRGLTLLAGDDYVLPFVRLLLIFALALPWLPSAFVQRWLAPVVSLLLWHVVLLPLTNAPGAQPIGVGKVARRIVGKAVLTTVKMDIFDTAGPLQLCSGQDAGCEVAIYAMRSVFSEESAKAILLVNARNTFNSLNRKVSFIIFLFYALPWLPFQLIPIEQILLYNYIDGKHLFSLHKETLWQWSCMPLV